MTQYQFEAFDPDEQSTITKEFQAVSLDTILHEFQYFLKGAGFEFDGNIEIVPELNYDTQFPENNYPNYDFNIEVK